MASPNGQKRFQPMTPDALLANINSQFEDAVGVVGAKVMADLETNLTKTSTNPDKYGIKWPIVVYDKGLPRGITFDSVAVEVVKRMRETGYIIEYTIIDGTQREPGSYMKITSITF